MELRRLDNRGTVLITSPQAGAAVAIDGKPLGNVPLELTLAAGSHDILLAKAGFSEAKSKVVIVAGERKEMRIELSATRSLLTRWWFWTGAAVVVAGGIATYVALTTEKSPPTGSIPPGQVATGLHF